MDMRPRLLALAVMNLAAGGMATGCGWIFDPQFVPGTYLGEGPCLLGVVNPSGAEEQQEFTTSTTMTIDEEGGFSVDGVELVVGAEVLRSTPTVDLAFEITKIARRGSILMVEYIPRPNPFFVGIAVEGMLVETYRWHAGSIRAAGHADLLVTDVSGTSTFTVNCEGVLTAR